MSTHNPNNGNDSLGIGVYVLAEGINAGKDTTLFPGFDSYKIVSHDKEKGYLAQSLADPEKTRYLQGDSDFIVFEYVLGGKKIFFNPNLEEKIELMELDYNKSQLT